MKKSIFPAIAGVLALSTVAMPTAATAARRGHAGHHRGRAFHESVTITKTSFHGWNDAYRVSNGVVDVVVIPSVGRVMAYHFTGNPDSSPIYINPGTAGQNMAASNAGTYRSMGGSELWPSPQDDWPKNQGNGWPPEVAIDEGPYTLSRIPNGVRLTGPESANFAVHAVRDITLRPGGTEVVLKASFVKAKDAAGDKDGFLIGIWADLQVRGDATVFFPIHRHSIFGSKGYILLRDKPLSAPYWTESDGLAVFKLHPGESSKVGFDDVAGWFGAIHSGNILFIERFKRVPGAVYPDKNSNAQFYTNNTEDHFMEIEEQGPIVPLRAGHTSTETITWDLKRLSRTPKNDADARNLVNAAVR